jgi:Flp pilus assembly pilin Flp
MTFVEILALQREARRVVDAGTAGRGAESWCEEGLQVDSAFTAPSTGDDGSDFESSGEASCSESKRVLKPRMVGQGMLEYALVVILVAIVVIVLLATVGHQAQDVFSNLSRGLAT